MENPSSPKKLAGRYEVREILGQGGMGLVYRAYDTVVRREVAVKTILDIPDPASLQLFYKECDLSLIHIYRVSSARPRRDAGEGESCGSKDTLCALQDRRSDNCNRGISRRLHCRSA